MSDDNVVRMTGHVVTDWRNLPPADPIRDLQDPGWREREAKRDPVVRSGSQIVTNRAVSPFRFENLTRLKLGEFDG